MKWFYNLKLRIKIMTGNLLIGIIVLTAGILIPNDFKSIGMQDIILLLTLISCVLLSVFLSWFISRSIADPINKLISYAERITLGQVDIKIENETKDEIGSLMVSFRKMIENIKENVTVAQKISNGDLNIDFKPKSDQDVLAKSMISVVNTLKDLESEIAMLTSEAVEGDLSTRGNANNFSGGYKNIVEEINKTLDAVVGPLNMSADYMDKISKGNIPIKITDDYKGDFNTIKLNINNCIDNINALIADTNMLAQSVVEGNLKVRADASKHSGDYKKIITGVNDTLDAIMEPLNESKQVMNKMSVNDYTIKMAGTYKGDMKEFAEDINSVHARLFSVQDAFIQISKGSTSRLEEFRKVGKRSGNDKLVPSIITTLTVINDLINESRLIAEAGTNGNFEVRSDVSKFEGGYKEILSGFNKTLDAIESPIIEASEILEKMASGNLTKSVEGDYEGNYAIIKHSINNTLDSFNKIIGNINDSADQVSTGSIQVSYASQALSQGATEQASSMEELTSSINKVAAQTKQNALNANEANELALNAKENAVHGNTQMKEMLKSMEEISESSASIYKIIKVIDDIAFQTNILALNAAVEAARAGQQGKGFAVVAEEVRNLAGRSANAAKQTTELIEGSIRKVEIGTKMANETSKSLNKILTEVEKSSKLAGDIAIASNDQATAISQIDIGIEQVSQVVQTNSATAEESAAASEELSSQAELLKNMVGGFELKKGNSSYALEGSKENNIRQLRSKKIEKRFSLIR